MLMPYQAYSRAASFVPALTTTVLKYLGPQPHERILDIGCGDGELTQKIAQCCKEVLGLDSSPSFIKTAQERYGSTLPNAEFVEWDCRRMNDPSVTPTDGFDKAFSNAAMHWILGDEHTRRTFFNDIQRLLKPGGLFVFEMGGAGNVPEVHTALMSVLHLAYKIPLDVVEAANPWFFASEPWMQKTLQQTAFKVDKIEVEYRPTKLTEQAADGSGGLSGWVQLMCSPFLELLPNDNDKKAAASLVCTLLKDVVTREDGSQWLGFVRLRAIARKE